MAKEVIYTREGFEADKVRLEFLLTTRRREVADRIQAAREFGDISENSEYDDAKNEQAQLEQEIAILEERLREAVIVDRVRMRVKVEDPDGKRPARETDYELVGSSEADPANGRISTDSPIGKALQSAKEGDVVDAATPRGAVRLKVLGVTRSA